MISFDFVLVLFVLGDCAFAQEYFIVTKDTNGTIQSPEWPEKYLSNSVLRWHLILLNDARFVEFSFEAFDVEGYSNFPDCSYDYVLIYPGTGPIANTPQRICDNRNLTDFTGYCNYHLPSTRTETIELINRRMVMEFCTDSIIQLSGFQFSWRALFKPPPTASPKPSTIPSTVTPPTCGQSISLRDGQSINISSPGFSGPYVNDLLCTWRISLTSGKVNITTKFFDLEGDSSDCGFDYLQLLVRGKKARYCGFRGVNEVITDSQITLQFVTDSRIVRMGFLINLMGLSTPTTPPPVDPKCGQTFTLSEVTSNVTLEVYDDPKERFCEWTVKNPLWKDNQVVVFRFLEFYTEFFNKLLVTTKDGVRKVFNGPVKNTTKAWFDTDVLTVVFHSGQDEAKPKFTILVSLMDKPFVCKLGEFKCKTEDKCIPISQRCDKQVNCKDKSDEDDAWCQMPSICGTQQVKPNIYVPGENIVNGTVAKPGSWPWIVSLHKMYARCEKPEEDCQVCGGTLVSPHWVVTAGHCVCRNPGPALYKVKVGSYHDDTKESPWEFDVAVRDIYIHPNFTCTETDKGFDISLIRLDADVPFPFNNFTNVACLPEAGHVVPGGTYCVVAGWGQTRGTAKDSTVLHQLAVPVVADAVCNDTDHLNGELVSNTMMCAGYEFGLEDSCRGDSGGPFVCKNASGNWFLQGVVSYGKDCALPHKPGVYARVSQLLDFLYNTIHLFD